MRAVPTHVYIDKSIRSIEQRMDERIVRIEKMCEQVVSESKTFRHTFSTSVMTGVITMIIGISGLIYALSQNMISAFDIGTSIKNSIRAEVNEQVKELNTKPDKLIAAPPKGHAFHETDPNTPSRRNKSDTQF